MCYTHSLAEYTTGLTAQTIPHRVQFKSKLNILDTLGVALCGSCTPHATAAFATAEALGGEKQASVIGRAAQTDMVRAAFLNALAAHSIDFDDAHKFVHPGAAIVPAALSVCEHMHRSGAVFMASVIAGYEVAVRTSLAAGLAHRKRGYHPTGTCNTLGAAAAAAHALGLDVAKTESALGIAGCQAAGLSQYRLDGSANKHLHAGIAAQGGVLAALLANNGFHGTKNILEGELGFLAVLSDGGKPSLLTDGLGATFAVEGTDIKPYPSCRQTHGAIDLALEAIKQGLRPSDITRIDIDIYEYATAKWHAANTPPETGLQAMLNIPYCVASALEEGSLSLCNFDQAALGNQNVKELTSKIFVKADPQMTAVFPEKRCVRLRISTSDGSQRTLETDNPKGGKEHPLTQDDVENKFRLLTKSILGLEGSERVIQLIGNLETLPDVGALAACLCGKASC